MKMAAPNLGKKRSGRPGIAPACSRYRKPHASSARRSASSGFVFLPLIPAIIREYRARHDTLPKEFVEFHAGLPEPDWAIVGADAWRTAGAEARCLELRTSAAAEAIEGAITKLRSESDDPILVGGPPCQAYSLVGRARAKGKRGYVPEDDERHYLLREYFRVLDHPRPAAFVMEKVKGMLS